MLDSKDEWFSFNVLMTLWNLFHMLMFRASFFYVIQMFLTHDHSLCHGVLLVLSIPLAYFIRGVCLARVFTLQEQMGVQAQLLLISKIFLFLEYFDHILVMEQHGGVCQFTLLEIEVHSNNNRNSSHNNGANANINVILLVMKCSMIIWMDKCICTNLHMDVLHLTLLSYHAGKIAMSCALIARLELIFYRTIYKLKILFINNLKSELSGKVEKFTVILLTLSKHELKIGV
ncbi:hypothetical protein RFI_33931 [Reticulomyxa filosa]|uniref:Uncharacterized protein n=1 Tax=Reticulomyxa filosa TaxID=46433 RepID=X6LRW2_RETFI|nr:hypothetical protein RFI_33931 [Reticulomyxa filosa]|eukprot:ETO03475.1 hypothetical protein RFI_33931 [Reticulomyxa filosa]